MFGTLRMEKHTCSESELVHVDEANEPEAFILQWQKLRKGDALKMWLENITSDFFTSLNN